MAYHDKIIKSVLDCSCSNSKQHTQMGVVWKFSCTLCTHYHSRTPLLRNSGSTPISRVIHVLPTIAIPSVPGKRQWVLNHKPSFVAILGIYPVYWVFTVSTNSSRWGWFLWAWRLLVHACTYIHALYQVCSHDFVGKGQERTVLRTVELDSWVKFVLVRIEERRLKCTFLTFPFVSDCTVVHVVICTKYDMK